MNEPIRSGSVPLESQRARPAISVCVPVYNGARYLDACLTAIASQTFTDFEAVIVDDRSSDGSMDIARAWCASDPRFVLHVNAENRGLVGNWNHCISIASGEWIKLLFQDDLMLPDCLATMLEAGRRGTGFVACRRDIRFEGDPRPELEVWYARHAALVAEVFANGGVVDARTYTLKKIENLGFNLVGEPSVTMIRKDLFDAYGLFDPLLVQVCDSEMWNRLASNVGLTCIDRELVMFRVHRGAASEAFRDAPFRGGVLDIVVERYRMCRSPQMARFREVATKAGKWAFLESELLGVLFHAFDVVRDAEKAGPDGAAMRAMLRQVTQQLMGYRLAAYLDFRHRLLRKVYGAFR